MFGRTSLHAVEVERLQFLRDGAACAAADGAVVQFADGGDFSSGASEEGFIGGIHFVAGNALFDDLVAEFVRQLHDGVAGDAFQRAGEIGRVDLALADNEDVFARAFGHETVHVQQQGFVVAVLLGLAVGQDGVHVIAVGLGLAHGDVDVVPREGRRLDADAVVQRFLAQIRAPFPRGDDDVRGQRLGGNAHGLGSVECHRPDVGRFQLVFAHGGALGFVDFFLGVGHVHAQDVRRAEQPVGMILQTENGRALGRMVGAHAFEHAHAVVQGVGKDVCGGIAPVDQLAVVPDIAIAVGHRHR